jgi:glycosyltransferase involved in cell wall biosynthesis
MKILHVVFSLEVGGMENGLVNVARGLPAEQYDIHVCCLERLGSFAARLPHPENVTVLDKPPGISFRTMWRLNQVIRRIRPDLIHSHCFGPLVYTVGATGLGLTCPVVHGEHGMLYPWEERRGYLVTRRFLYSRCRKIHTVSKGLKEHYVAHGFRSDRIEVVTNGVDESRFCTGSKESARGQIALPTSGRVIGMVGSYSARKRHRILFQAFELIAQERPEVRLLVVGGGEGREAEEVVEQAKASRYADRIHLVGVQKNPVTYYQAMDIMVLPSINEGLSNATLESMACGVPALVHDACGSADVIENGVDGCISNIQTAEQLASEMKQMLGEPERLKVLGANARQKVLNEFSMRAMIDGYERLYRGAM